MGEAWPSPGEQIRRYTAERVTLAGSAAWTGHSLGRDEVLALAQDCVR